MKIMLLVKIKIKKRTKEQTNKRIKIVIQLKTNMFKMNRGSKNVNHLTYSNKIKKEIMMEIMIMNKMKINEFTGLLMYTKIVSFYLFYFMLN